jgi:parallel beta-helix repeat protein
MRAQLTILLLLPFCLFAKPFVSQSWYLSNTGNDLNSGTSSGAAWATIAKLNANWGSISAGDRIYFERGGTFYGTITIGKSGASGNPIVLDAYGTGANPIVIGFTIITSGWTNEGGGIYSKIITSSGKTNMVVIDGVQYAMGRYPDNKWLTFQSYTGGTKIVSTGLNATGNWTGYGMVLRAYEYGVDRCTIGNQKVDTITYANNGAGLAPWQNGWGFFIQDGLNTLTTYGEWYHDYAGTGKFYMYFGGVTPTTKTVQVATVNNVLTNASFDYIRYQNIDFTGSIGNAVEWSNGVDYCSISNSVISFAGNSGIAIAPANGDSTQTLNDSVFNCTIQNCNKNGVATDGRRTYIGNNTITHIGQKIGQQFNGNEGIYSPGYDVEMKYNTIRGIGYNGITVKYLGGSLVQYNLIDSTLTHWDDGGAIYTSGATSKARQRLIDHNIITNVIGNEQGTPNTLSTACGIYLDEGASGIVVSGNSVANVPFLAGIKLHKSLTNTIRDNTLYNDSVGIYSQDDAGEVSLNNFYQNNIVVSKNPTQHGFNLYSNTNNVNTNYRGDSNVLVRPFDNLVFGYKQPNTGYIWIYKTLAQWQKLTGEDANSNTFPTMFLDLNNFYFYYNATSAAVTLGPAILGLFNYSDMRSVNYPASITLQPYESAVLFKGSAIPRSKY